MKKYYLVAEKSAIGGSFIVKVTDNPRGTEILKEFEAENYVEAVHRYSFMTYGIDKAAFCGTSPDGRAYHGES